jgi:hypothetical protein
MALTKNDIVEQIQRELGVLRNKSVEITESLLVAGLRQSPASVRNHKSKK